MSQALAVIGMACRLPGGIDTASQFWELLKSGGEVVGDLPRDRWDIHGWHHRDPARPGKSYASKGGFRRNIDMFDADFFGISPREASRMDPQQRLLLEMTWEALEDAGQVPEALAGTNAAVIFGISSLDYQNVQLLDPESVNAYSNLGCAASIAANRISHFFDLRGPSFILDTACSSSLVALHNACEAIWSGGSPLAVAGGANVLLSPFPWVGFSKARMLSLQGHCRVFDAAADGYVRSEGGGVVVLKSLDRARADGDPIRAVILASGINSDGRTQGLFLPSARAQEELLREVYARAGVEPSQVSFVEAHGTGTLAGDPIECEALGAALGTRRTKPLPIGSVKTNLGHLEAAAGIAGVMKVILALEHREIPPSLHFETPNPRIRFAETNLEVVTRHTSLAGYPGPLAMGVNSFGFGGANAHVVLEEYRGPAVEKPEPEAASCTLPLFLSARSPEALRATAVNHALYLSEPAGLPLYDICWTAAMRRGHHPYRLAVFGRSAEELSGQLTAFAEGQAPAGVVSEKALPGSDRPVFVFSGNGSQWPGMGRELMRESPVFRQTVERADREFVPLAGWSLGAALLDADGDDRMARTEVAQPLLFAVQAGLVELLAACGLSPRAVAGHSVGEVAAAWAAGIYSLEQAVRVIHARSRAQTRAAGRGKMAACGLSAEQAAAVLSRYGGALDVASINSPRSTTISGEAAALSELGGELERQGVFFRTLEIDYPFHSHLMNDVREPLLKGLAGLRPHSSRLRFVSSTSGGVLAGEEMGAEYWWDNVRRPVLFGSALELLIREGDSLFVEVGPHPVLDGYIRQCLEAENTPGRAVPTLRRREPEMPQVLSAIGLCHALGCTLDMRRIFPRPGNCVALPLYPWQRERHWNGGAFGPPRLPRGEFEHPLLGYRSTSAEPLWENDIDVAELPYLADHRVIGVTLFPIAGFVEMALKAAELFRGTPYVDIEDIEVRRPLLLEDGHRARIQFSVCLEDGTFRIRSRSGDDAAWALASTGRLGGSVGRARPAPVSLDTLRSRMAGHLSSDDFYRQCSVRGLQYGPAFRGLEEVWAGDGEALGRLAPEMGLSQEGYCFHPALLDACLHLSAAASFTGTGQDDASYLGRQIRRFRLFADGSSSAFCHAWVERRSERSIVLHVRVLDAEGAVVAEVEGLRAGRVETTAVHSSALPLLEMRAVLAPLQADREQKRTWLVLRDAAPEGRLLESLAERLTQAGHRVIERVAPLDDPEAFRRLFLDLAAEGIHCDELIHGWGLTRNPPESTAELEEFTNRRSVSALSLVQGLTRAELPALPRLWLLTRGAMPISPAAGKLNPAHASLWGLGRVVAHETPGLSLKLVDLHWIDNPSAVLDRLAAELGEGGAEDEIILTEEARYVHRVSLSTLGERTVGVAAPDKESAFRLVAVKPGSLDSLVLERCERPAPGPSQVEIRVRAAGLNFRDLMWALRLLPDEALETGLAGPTLGMECAGEIVRVGEAVSGLRAGDAVAAFAPQCFGAFVLAEAAHVSPKPADISYEGAATLLTAFATVVYSLEHLGRLRRGERILIHGAAGGVGLAAIQYAMHVGAEVFATAGTEEKREYLRNLGVPHVFSSRSLEFAGEILQATGGEGVDVVLNSLAGEAVAHSFSVLRPFGRFLELGKRDFLEHNRMAMAPFRNNLSYFGIDLDQALATRPDVRDAILARVVELISLDVLRPLPFRVFPVSRVREAFRHMQQSQHIGKIVVSFDDPDVRVLPGDGPALALRSDGTYLVTGGLSGLGLETARWLARKRARHLVLVSRSGAATPEAAAAVEELRAAGCQVLAASVDVADESALRQLLARVSDGMPPLRGVVHAAMALDDAPAPSMTPERFWRAARPKILGAWNLHRLTLEAPLEFFVLYSSVAFCLGNPGQSNYAAGNAFLESLAAYRCSLGLPGTAIAWGAISDAGYLARNPDLRDKLETRLALRSLSARQALRYLDQILGRDGPNWIAADLNWPKLRSASPGLARSPRFAALFQGGTEAPETAADEELLALWRTLPPDEARQAVAEILARELARVLGGTRVRLDLDRPLADLGLDSLMAVELLTAIEARFHVQINPLEIMGGVTISQVARRVAASLAPARDPDG